MNIVEMRKINDRLFELGFSMVKDKDFLFRKYIRFSHEEAEHLIIFFADMRVKQNRWATLPVCWAWDPNDTLPGWLVSRTERQQVFALVKEGLYRNENYLDYQKSVQDGICKTCRTDFQGEGYYCSSCDKKFEEWRRDKIRQKYEILAICLCGVRLTKDSSFIHQVREFDVGPIKQLVTHHTSYSPEETMPVCSSCHSKIEHSNDPEFKQYKAKDKRPKYIRKTIDVWCDSCRGKTPVHKDVIRSGPMTGALLLIL